MSVNPPPNRRLSDHVKDGMAGITELRIALTVARFDEALDLYGDVLGLRVGELLGRVDPPIAVGPKALRPCRWTARTEVAFTG